MRSDKEKAKNAAKRAAEEEHWKVVDTKKSCFKMKEVAPCDAWASFKVRIGQLELVQNWPSFHFAGTIFDFFK